VFERVKQDWRTSEGSVDTTMHSQRLDLLNSDALHRLEAASAQVARTASYQTTKAIRRHDPTAVAVNPFLGIDQSSKAK
jgi:hypothetical protein